RSTSTASGSDIVRLPASSPSFRGTRSVSPESRDSGLGPDGRPPRNDGGLYLQVFSRHPPIRFQITLARRVHHARRKRRCGRIAVPSSGAALGVEIIAQGLLVETRLGPTGLVGIDGPKAGGVRRHHLIDQDDPPVPVAAEFEFGVGDNDALLPRELL